MIYHILSFLIVSIFNDAFKKILSKFLHIKLKYVQCNIILASCKISRSIYLMVYRIRNKSRPYSPISIHGLPTLSGLHFILRTLQLNCIFLIGCYLGHHLGPTYGPISGSKGTETMYLKGILRITAVDSSLNRSCRGTSILLRSNKLLHTF